MKRETWTIEPDDDVKSLVSKEITRRAGRNKKNQRGVRTRIINDAIRNLLASLSGKRELGKAKN